MSTQVRVLLVEDNACLRRSLGRVFEAHDAITMVAAVPTLWEAKRTLRSEGVDVILSDLNLGDGLGVELVTSSPNTGLVLMTGEQLRSDVRASYVALGLLILDKPFRTEACYAAVLAASQG